MEKMYRLEMLVAICISGFVGVMTVNVDWPSAGISAARALIGTAFIGLMMLIGRKKLHWQLIKKNFPVLLLGGVVLGAAWTLLAQAIKMAGSPVASVCYNMAPIFIMIGAPLLINEKLKAHKVIAILISAVGVLIISDIKGGTVSVMGVILALIGAAFSGGLTFINKAIQDLDRLERSFVQEAIAGVLIFAYAAITQGFSSYSFTMHNITGALILGLMAGCFQIVFAFDAIAHLPAQTSALMYFIDPVIAIISSAILINQVMTPTQLLGSLLIIGAVTASEIIGYRKHKKSLQS